MSDISINSKFLPFMCSKSRFQMLKGGRGSSKSHHAGLKMIFGILGIDPETWKKTTKPFRGVMSRDTHENIRDGQYAEIVDLIKLYELEDRIQVGKSPFSFYCPDTGFNIIAKATTASRKTAKSKTKGIKDPTLIWVDELPDMEYDHFRKLSMSVRKIGADCQIICCHNTDIDENHWVRKHFYSEERTDTFYLHSTYLDNIANLNAGAVAEYEYLKVIDPELYSVEVLGGWGKKKVIRPFATQYDQKKHRKECQLQPNRTIYLSLDFNLDPFAFNLYHIWEDVEGFHLHAFDEMSIDSGSLPEAANQIRAKYGHLLHNFHITGDYNGTARSMQSPSNESNYKMLLRLLGISERQLEVKPNPRHKNSRSDCNFLFAYAEDIRIGLNCVNLERDLRTVEVDPDEKIIKSNRNKAEQQADHLDDFRYLVNSRIVQEWKGRKQNRR